VAPHCPRTNDQSGSRSLDIGEGQSHKFIAPGGSKSNTQEQLKMVYFHPHQHSCVVMDNNVIRISLLVWALKLGLGREKSSCPSPGYSWTSLGAVLRVWFVTPRLLGCVALLETNR